MAYAKRKTKKTTAKRKPAPRAAVKKPAPRKKAPAVKKAIAVKKAKAFHVECKKSASTPWEKLCSSSTKRAAFLLAHAYFKSNPTHKVRVTG